MKRLFDIVFSLSAILFLWPVMLFIAVIILTGSPGGIFYRQIRIGKNFREFNLLKFRTMRPGSDQKGLITVGGKDNRITREGYFLRKYKLDELPQFFNILLGDMSFVGPRPEVKKYVDMFQERYKNILQVKPGLTDYASLEYISENEILGKSSDPEKTYTEEILPHKLDLADLYVKRLSFAEDIRIIFRTLLKIIKG
ncbi:MAG: sugar transferase [Flavobacteriales bacterium]|nr:sugar transferase [Flavobacteriales bacterium]